MSAGHHHRLYRPGDTPVHRLPAQCKLVAAVGFAVAVVATPRERLWAFGVQALLLSAVAAFARVPPAFLLRRMVIVVPVVLFAVAIPVIGTGERVEVLGMPLSVQGLWAAWSIVAKASLGVGASILLAATTEPRVMLLGAERLRLPRLLVQIAMFMLRYLDVILDQMRRMRIARDSRGFVARDIRQAPVLASAAGALFIRSYERGERVHLAMLSRGYTGRLPATRDLSASRRDWGTAALLPALAAATAMLSWSLP